MKIQVIQRLLAARNLLEQVDVHGKKDCKAMANAMDILEEVSQIVNDCEISLMAPLQPDKSADI